MRHDAGMVEDRNFSLALEDNWRQLPSDGPGIYIFVDESRGVTMRLSAAAQDILPGDLDRLAWLLVDRETEKETSAAQALGHAATIYEPIIMPQPWGRAVAFHGACHGQDVIGRRFGFSGSITCRCTIGLGLSTETLSESALLTLMDGLSSRIDFDRTPMETESPLGRL